MGQSADSNGFNPKDRLTGLFGLLAACTFAVTLATPATALDSGWAEAEGGRMRIVIDPQRSDDGRMRGVLDIDLEPGWKTYWTEPGGSGIPPTIDLSASRGVTLLEMRLPAPVHVDDGYSVWAGYKHPVRFALDLKAPDAATLKANIFIGICEDICVPFQANLSVDIPAPSASPATDTDAARIVADGFFALPEIPSEDFSIDEARFDTAGGTIMVDVTLPGFRPAGAEPDLFVSGAAGWAFSAPKLIESDARAARFAVAIAGRPKDHQAGAQPLHMVATFGRRAIATSIPVEAPGN